MKGRILAIVLALVLTTMPMAANAGSVPSYVLEWQDIGEAAPGEAALTALVGLSAGEIIAGTVGSGMPYIVRYDISAGTFSPKTLVPGSGAHVSRLAVGSNNEVYASTSRTLSVGNSRPELVTESGNVTRAQANELVWVAPHDGTFYFAVTPGPGSAIGCDATYELTVETIPGDVTGDCLVDVFDIQRVMARTLTSRMIGTRSSSRDLSPAQRHGNMQCAYSV